MQELWRRLQEETANLGYEMSGGSLYLDPDIIDLTLIPPPITPEKVFMNIKLEVYLLDLFLNFIGRLLLLRMYGTSLIFALYSQTDILGRIKHCL